MSQENVVRKSLNFLIFSKQIIHNKQNIVVRNVARKCRKKVLLFFYSIFLINFLVFFLLIKTKCLINDIINTNILITYYMNGVDRMKDTLKDSIKSHYENKDYTEVVRDSLLCLTTEIRKKSDLVDIDGVDLINKAFSEKQPLIKINKLETTTDKNRHRGIMDLSRGLIEYFRNPMSHSKQEYSKKVTDAILVLLDEVILEEIVGSKSINSLEDWYLEITNELFPNTERYAKN